MAKKPSIAPTAMKTVPSGRELVCMYGAPAFGGTEAGTILKAPVRVGNPEGRPSASPPAFGPVIVGTGPVNVSDCPPPVITAVVATVLDAPPEIDASPVVLPVVTDLVSCDLIALERFGRSLLLFCAEADVANKETAKVRGRENRMSNAYVGLLE